MDPDSLSMLNNKNMEVEVVEDDLTDKMKLTIKEVIENGLEKLYTIWDQLGED